MKTVTNKQELNKELIEIKNMKGPVMLVVKIKKGSRKDLGRITRDTVERKKLLMGFLSK